MPPKAKDKEPPAEPPVNLEELQLHIAQLGDEIATVKENIETRAKDYADSLSTFDVPWPLTSVAHGAGVLFSGSLDNRVLGVDVKAHTDRFEVVAAAPVFCIALLPEAGVLCAGTDCGNIECWNSLNCEPVGELAGHTARVSCLRRPETEQHLWSSSHDGTIRQWDMRELKCVRTFKVCDFQVSSFVLESGTIYAGAWDATVRAIDASTGECTAFFRGHEHIVHALTADKRGQNIYSASGDHKVIQWSVDPSQGFDRTPKARFNGHIDAVLCLHILVLEDFVAAVCGEQAAAAEGDASVRGDTMTVQEMELLRDPCMPAVVLITGSDDRSIRLFDAETGQCLLVLIGHTDAVTGFEVDNGVLYSSSFDHSVRSWQLQEALIRIQMRRNLKNLEIEKAEKEELLEANSKKKKKGKKKK